MHKLSTLYKLSKLCMGLFCCSYLQSTYASPDTVCWSDVNIELDYYSYCNNLPILAAGNDNRTNMYLLLADRGLASIQAEQQNNDEYEADYGIVPFEAGSLGNDVHNKINNQRKNLNNDKSRHSYEERCNTIESGEKVFRQQLESLKKLTSNEKQQLTTYRANLKDQCDDDLALIQVDPAWSQPARQYASYLNASIAFYNGDFTTAEKIFEILTTVDDPWLKETSTYMLVRIAVNQSYKSGLDQYGYLEANQIDPKLLTKLFNRISVYFTQYPKGQYVASARGFLRRGYWFMGDQQKLINEITWQINNTKNIAYNLDMAQLAPELDRHVFSSENFNPSMLKDPLLLSTYDLMFMRKSDTKDYQPLSWKTLEAQQSYFKNQPELYAYLKAVHLFTLQNKPNQALNYLPKQDPQRIDNYLQLSQVVLKGRIFKAQGQSDQQLEQYWKNMLSKTSDTYHYAMLETALAISAQNTADYDLFITPNSPIKQTNLRMLFIRNVANAATLEKIILSKSSPMAEKYQATYSLLRHSLMLQNFALFTRSYQYLPKNAQQFQGWKSTDESLKNAPSLAVFIWQGNKIDESLSCPNIMQVTTALSQNPNNQLMRLCLGEFIRISNTSYYPSLQENRDFTTAQSRTFGDIRPPFTGVIFSRGDVYQDIIRNKQNSSLQAYALYRAVQCYAPSGINDCDNKDVDISVRKAWFDKLHRDYPDSTWTNSLKYYW